MASRCLRRRTSNIDLPELRPEIGVFLSENSGRSWKRIAGNSTFRGAMPLMDIACAPSDPAVMYVAGTAGVGKRPANSLRFPRGNGEYGGVFRSSDSGESWEPASGPEMGNCVEIAVHPLNPEIVFAACYNGVVKLADGKPERTYGGVYRTTDGGRTWQCVLRVSDYVLEDGCNSWYGNGVTSVAINPELPNIAVASMNLAGVFRTVDGGDTWQRVDWERFQRYQRNYHSISINPHDPSELCLGLFGCAFVAYRDPVVIEQLEEGMAREPNLLKNGDFEIRGSDGLPASWEIGNQAMLDGREVLSVRESPGGEGVSLCAAYDADKAEVRADGQRIEAWADCRVSPFMLSRARGKKVKVSMEAWLDAGGHDGLRPALLLVETRDGREYVIAEVTASVAYGASGEPSSGPPLQRRMEWVKYESYAQVSEKADSLRAHIWACSKGKGVFYFDNVRIELAE